MSVVANVAINVDAANAIQQLNRVKTAAGQTQGGFDGAAKGAKGLGAALQSAIGPLLTITTALTAVKKGLDTAFERGAAEQRLKNITDSAGEFRAAMALAADSSQKFGLTQTEATTALADVFSRLKGVGFGLQETGEIYQGFNAIAKQSGLAGAEAAGAFFQLSQALGKGKLNGDEFVIVAERMPQLLDAIAQTTGKSRGELTEMASQGQITSQVLYEALSGAADASGGLTTKLTAQQRAMSNLRQVTDELLNSIGKVFGPVVIAGVDGLTAAGQMLADWWNYVGNVVFRDLYEAIYPVIQSLKAAFEDVNFDVIRVAIQNILIKGFEIAAGIIGNFSKVLAFVIDRFKELSQNPVFKFIADQVGRLAGFLGLTTDKVGEFKSAQQGATEEAAATVKQYSSLPPVIEDAKEAAKQLKEQQKAVTEEIKSSKDAYDNAIKSGNRLVDNQLKLTQARYSAEKAINDVYLGQAQRQLDSAKTQSQRITAAKRILELTIANAKIEYNSAIAAIDAETRKVALMLDASYIRAKEVETTVNLAIAQGTVTKEHYAALNAAREAYDVALGQYQITQQVSQEQKKVASAIYEGSVQAAEAAYQTNIIAKNTQAAANAANSFAGGMSNAAGVTRTLEQMQANVGRFGAPRISTVTLQPGQYLGARTRRTAMFAEGGYVAKATEAVVGEGGPEYIIPSSKMDAAMARYAAGKRGDSVIPDSSTAGTSQSTDYSASINPQVNVTTGPVMNMNGSNYVSQRDFIAGMKTASRRGAEMALSAMRNNGAIRRSVGAR